MKLRTVTFKLHNDQELVAKDTAEVKNGTHAFEQFKHEEIAKVVTEEGDTYYVPFHAVIWVKVVEEAQTIEPVEDANCNYECDC